MLRNAVDFWDEDRLKANITMKDGVEFLGVDLVTGTADNVIGFAWEGGFRFVNREDTKYVDWYLDDELPEGGQAVG